MPQSEEVDQQAMGTCSGLHRNLYLIYYKFYGAKKIFSVLAALAVSFMFISCEGDGGPEGPKGDSGPLGTAGPKGEQGDKGDTGSPAADGSSVVFVLNNLGGEIRAGIGQWGGWNLNSAQATFLQAPSSVILTYLQMESGSWYRVPGPVIGANGTHVFAVGVYDNAGIAQVRVIRTKSTGPLRFESARVIIIKSDPNARKVAVDYDDYQAVKKFYNLED